MANFVSSDKPVIKNYTMSCPSCSSQFTKRIRRRTVGERLLSLFYIYPFSCQLCGETFSLFQPGVRYVRVDEDQRVYQRIRVELPIVLTRDELNCHGSAIEISMRGCTVNAQEPLAIGSIVKIALKIPNENDTLTVEAAIVRNSAVDRIGLEFLRFEGNERERLRYFVQSLLSVKYQ